MASSWQGGDKFVMVRRGSGTSRAGGANSGPSGRRRNWFNPNPSASPQQSAADKAAYAQMVKDGKRPVRIIKSGIR